jgi:hypothetical protein
MVCSRKVTHLLLFSFLFCLPLFSLSKQEKLAKIDKEIEELQDEKRGFEGQALYHENTAQRLQFIDGELITAKKHFKLADEYRLKAREKEIMIQKLLKQREMLQNR